jgi:hypothetical protein
MSCKIRETAASISAQLHCGLHSYGGSLVRLKLRLRLGGAGRDA